MVDRIRWICEVCRAVTTDGDELSAPNPFDVGAMMTGCPRCYSVDRLVIACHNPACDLEGSSGEPWPDGVYRWSCHEHAQWAQPRAAMRGPG